MLEMKRALQLLAGVIPLVVVIIWAAKGANTGWTKTKVQSWTVDEITEIRVPIWQEKFVPGLDFLGVGLFSAAALAGASRFIRTNKEPITIKQNQA